MYMEIRRERLKKKKVVLKEQRYLIKMAFHQEYPALYKINE